MGILCGTKCPPLRISKGTVSKYTGDWYPDGFKVVSKLYLSWKFIMEGDLFMDRNLSSITRGNTLWREKRKAQLLQKMFRGIWTAVLVTETVRKQ